MSALVKLAITQIFRLYLCSRFNIMQSEMFKEDDIVQMLNTHYQNGVRVRWDSTSETP